MSTPYKILHCVNQFFGGLGGEDQANLAPSLVQGPKGPGMLIQKLFPNVEVIATVIFGDNYLAENTETAVEEILSMLERYLEGDESKTPDLLVAGPAFNAGRYGIACGAICQAVQKRLDIPAVTAMFTENPAVDLYRKTIFIAETSDDVIGMPEAIKRMIPLAIKLVRQETLLPEEDNYIPQGRRKNIFDAETGARRAINMLLKRLKGSPFQTEYPMPVFDRATPAPPIEDISQARLALVTSGGIVPRGNPDKIEAANAQRFGTYSIKNLQALSPQTHQTAHGGYDPTFANENPNRVLPLDVVRELESEGAIGSLHDYYYATVGNATSVESARKYGQRIAKILQADGVQAVILTST